MSNNDEIVLVISNAPDVLLAKRIAHVLVEDGLAACVNLGAPALSMYTWQGQIEGAEEIPLTIKTTLSRSQEVVQALTRLHPYEVPEILIVPVVGGHPGYLQWVRDTTGAA